MVLYELITGERLFVHAGLTTSPDQIYSQPIPLISRKVEGLPADLDKVMLRALSLEPGGRYQTAGELQEALLRVAHRHGLLMSAPEVAAHLRKVCGPPERWRDLEMDRGGTGAIGGAGTEVYDLGGGEGTDQLSVDDLDDDDFGPAILPPRSQRAKTSLTHLSRLQNMELTSMINLAGLEAQGARPLVDLDGLGSAREAPRGKAEVRIVNRTTTGVPLVAQADAALARAAEPARRASEPVENTAHVDPVVDEPPRSRRWSWVIAIVLLLAAAGGALWLGLSGPQVERVRSHVGSGSSAP